jgi:hypothetical protein
LALLDVFPSGGIRPHDLAVAPDPAKVAIAHYGSIGRNPDARVGPDPAPRPLAPGIALLDGRTGRRLGFLPGTRADVEVRHLAIAGNAILVGQTRTVESDAPEVAGLPRGLQDSVLWRYAPSPLAVADGTLEGLREADVRAGGVHALSMAADVRQGEVLVGLAGEDALLVVGLDGRLRRRIDLAPLGCRSLSGIGIIGDAYLVCGHLQGAWLFERSTHRLLSDRWAQLAIDGHSHLSIG